jgi:eukaryotic-like serine/threonine-protein kinase
LGNLSKSAQGVLKSPLTPANERVYAFGPFRMDARERLLLQDDVALPLAPKAFETLLLLVRNHGRLLSKEELMASIWGETAVEESNLSQTVFVLRKALGDRADDPRYIETVPKVGYRFVGPVREVWEEDVESAAPGETTGTATATARRALGRGSVVIVGVALASAAVAVTWLWWRSRPAEVGPPTLHRLSYSGRDHGPAASPDGKLIAFVSERDGRPRIWLKQVSSGSEIALTAGPDDWPRFSADGSTILFSRDEGGHRALYRVAALGGEPLRVLEAAEGDWSPDGRRIVFVRRSREDGLGVTAVGLASANGGDAHDIFRLEGANLDSPRWSPDGRRIAVRQAGGSTGVLDFLRLLDPDGGADRKLGPPGPGGRISTLVWSSGTEILYAQSESLASTRSGVSTRIVRLDVGTGEARDIFWVPERIHTLDVASPGRLVFDVHSSRENLHEGPHPSLPQARAGRWLTREHGNDRQPAYSPDGERVVFSSDRSRNLDLWEVSTRTGNLRRVTDDAADDWDPAFTRDGRRLVWSSNRSGTFEIWIADASGSGARQLTRDGLDAENPTSTPDGEWIVYSSAHPEKAGIWKIRADGSDAARVVAGPAVWPEVSPDGRHVAYRSAPYDWPRSRLARVSVRVARLSDGAVLPFAFEVKEQLSAGRTRWLPDGRGVAFVGADEEGRSGVYVREFAPERPAVGPPRLLAAPESGASAESFGISPDGTRITVASWEQLSSLMMASRVPGLAGRSTR